MDNIEIRIRIIIISTVLFYFCVFALIDENKKEEFRYEPVLKACILNDGTEYHGPFNSYEIAYNDMPNHNTSDGYYLYGETINNEEMKYYWYKVGNK